METSLSDLARLMLTDPAIPQYAAAVVAALVDLNQDMVRKVESIHADVAAMRAEMKEWSDERRSKKGMEMVGRTAGEDPQQQSNGDLAFSVYLRKGQKGEEKREGEGIQEEEEEDDEEGHEDTQAMEVSSGSSYGVTAPSTQEPMPGGMMSADEVMRSLVIALGSSSAFLAPHPMTAPQQTTTVPLPTVNAHSFPEQCDESVERERQEQSSSSASTSATQHGKRTVLPCPRRDCEVILFSELGFSAHLRVHDGRMPFECTNCGREFRLRDGLVKHMRTHTGERPYPCQVCGKNFKRVHHRKKHLQAKHLSSADQASSSPAMTASPDDPVSNVSPIPDQ